MQIKISRTINKKPERALTGFFEKGEQLEVGFFSSSGMTHSPHPSERMIDVAIRNEYGGINQQGIHVLPRPFMRGSVGDKNEWAALGRTLFTSSFSGNRRLSLTTVLSRLGASVVKSIRKSITHGTYEPLHKRYLAWRRRHGIKGTKPLVATGSMRDAVNYRITDQSGGEF